MTRKSIYQIASSPEEEQKYFLFGKRSFVESQDENLAKKLRKPEEHVRQWAIYELLTTYGIKINSIEIEKSARDHSKYYPADIVVNRNGRSYIVVECKKQHGNNPKKVLEQAQVYANDLKAKFAVYTDGHDWKVTRNVAGEWMPVNDIPSNADEKESDSITDSLWFIKDLNPILFWIHRQIPVRYAHKFMSLVQEFFAGYIVNTKGFSSNITIGTEFLLRIIAGGGGDEEISFPIEEYQTNTLRAVYVTFNKYFKEIGFPTLDVTFVHHQNFRELFGSLWDSFDKLVRNHENMAFGDVNIARFVLALFQYLNEMIVSTGYESGYYKDIPASLVNQFEKLIESLLISKFNLRLPSPLDSDDIYRLRIITSEKWVNSKGEMP